MCSLPIGLINVRLHMCMTCFGEVRIGAIYISLKDCWVGIEIYWTRQILKLVSLYAVLK